MIGSGLVRYKVAMSGPVNHFNSHKVKGHKLHYLIRHGFCLYHGVLAFRNENIHLNLLEDLKKIFPAKIETNAPTLGLWHKNISVVVNPLAKIR